MAARLSIIIPVFKGRRFLREAVTSVLSQDFPETEILLVDDQTPDDSLEAGKMSLPVKDAAGCGSSQNASRARELQRQLRANVERGAALPVAATLTPGRKLAIIACAATASWLLVAALCEAVAALATLVS